MTRDTSGCEAACARALAELEAYLDGELAEASVRRIREHLHACYPCMERATFEEQLRAIIRDGCVDRAPPDLVVRVRRRLSTAWLVEE